MSGLNNTVKRIGNASLGRGYMTNQERRDKKKAQVTKAKNKMNAMMPDEEDIRRVERRKAAKRRGSRASTVMTDRETLG